jgi:hypothetical protein
VTVRRVSPALGVLLLLALGWGLPAQGAAESAAAPLPGICSDADRFGFGKDKLGNPIDSYDMEALHAGWYTDFGVDAAPMLLAGLRYVQVIRVSDDGPFPPYSACSRCPTWNELHLIASQHPGSLWLIGNEPDRQDYVGAERYAQLYHDFYAFLKSEDPSCLVGVGGVVQPTPIRLQYLDLILDSYDAQYGEPMPVDVWNTHNYVLREGTGWGCGLPPGTDPALAIEYDIQEHDMLDPSPTDPAHLGWKQHLVLMRQWMRDRGYRDRPLIISEYGILMPEFYGFDSDRVRTFMHETLDWLMEATDPETGYPADGNRLVQAWSWFSLDMDSFEGYPTWNHLFDPDTTELTALGSDFGGYTAPLVAPCRDGTDLRVVAIHEDLLEWEAIGGVTTTLTADIYNYGGNAPDAAVVRFERDGAPAGEVTVSGLQYCSQARASVVWSDLPQAVYLVTATVSTDPPGDCDPTNDSLSASMLIAAPRSFIPMIWR